MTNRLAGTVCFVLMATQTATAAQKLSAAQLTALAPASYAGFLNGNKAATISLYTGGQIVGRTEGKYEVGKWFVQGSQLCIQFKVWTSNKPRCGAVFRDGPWLVGLNKDGEPQVKLRKNGMPPKATD